MNEFSAIWAAALRVIASLNRQEFRPVTRRYSDGTEYVGTDYCGGPRYWHTCITDTYELHPVVQHVIGVAGIRPVNWQNLLLEWPHISEVDDTLIAYTRDERAGLDFIDNGSKRQTKTSIGKYLSRHWPHVRDDVRRDWAARFKPAVFAIWDTRETVICAVELGPRSCMKSTYGSIPFKAYDNAQLLTWYTGGHTGYVDWASHPYSVYDPALGWRMAVRMEKGNDAVVMGRALLHEVSKTYVRTYKRNASGDEGDYSYADEQLEAWMTDQGYRKASDWEGKRIARVDHPSGGLMVPYLDGGAQSADEDGHLLVICRRGKLSGSNTDGGGGTIGADVIGTCADCGSAILEDDDDRICAGRGEDREVCGDCASGYTYVRGATNWGSGAYSEYYVADDDVLHLAGIQYDSENLPDNLITLHNGDVCEHDDAVYLEGEGEYYEAGSDAIVAVGDEWFRKDDDESVVACADGEYRLRGDCWMDATTRAWFWEDDVAPIVLDGQTYHPETARAQQQADGQLNLDLE